MITQFIRRQLAASGLILAVAVSMAFAQPAAGQPAPGGTTGAAASQPDPKQQVAEFLLSSIGPGEAARYPDVMEAITRALNNDGAGAQALLEKAAKNNRSLPPSEVMIARLLLRLGQPAPGRNELEKAVVAHPKDPEAYLLFAEGALQDNRITDAEALLSKVQPYIKEYNESPKRKTYFDSHLAADLTAVAVARAAAGASEQWDTAVERAKEWVAADKDSAQAHQQLGRALFKQMKGDGYAKNALNEFQTAAEKDKNATHPYVILAQLYQEAGKDADAKQSIVYALDPRQGGKDLNVNLQAANWALSTSTQENKRLDDAQKYADAAIQIDPKSLDAKVLRAVIARLKGDLTTAEKLLKDVVDTDTRNVAANNQLALVLIELADQKNDPAKRQQAMGFAENNMLRTTQGNQFSPEVFATYAWVLYKSGEKEKAGQYLDKVLATKQLTPDMAYYVGKMLQDANKVDQAIQFLESAAKSAAPFAQRDATNKLLAELKTQKDKDDKDKKGTEPTSTPASK